MADNKKGFVLYTDLIFTVKKLPKDKQGELFMTILEYVNDMNPEVKDLNVDLVFEPIKRQLKRDLKHWDNVRQVRSENGKKGGRPKKLTKANKPNAFLEKQTKAKKAVIVTVTDTVKVKGNVKDILSNRDTEFKNSLKQYLETYGSDMLNSFYLYWTEKKPKGRKMRFEMEKTFDISRRLQRWNNNNFNKNKEKNFGKKEKIDAATLIQQKYGLS